MVLAVALTAAVLRLMRAKRFAEYQIQSQEDRARRRRQRNIAAASLLGAVIITAIAVRESARPWLWLASAVAWISSMQWALAIFFRRPGQLLWLARIIGGLFTLVALAIYLILLR